MDADGNYYDVNGYYQPQGQTDCDNTYSAYEPCYDYTYESEQVAYANSVNFSKSESPEVQQKAYLRGGISQQLTDDGNSSDGVSLNQGIRSTGTVLLG